MNFPITIPVLMKLDFETSDGRLIEKAGFKGIPEGQTAKLYALDSQGIGGHTFAKIVGELTSVSVADDGIVSGKGWLMGDEFGIRVANLVENKLLTGMSADLNDDYVVQYVEEYNSETEKWTFKMRFTESSLAGGTLCEKPAFPDAYVQLESPLPDEFKFSAGAKHEEACTSCDEAEPCTSCSGHYAEREAAIEAELQTIIEASKTRIGDFSIRVFENYTPPEILTYDKALFERPELRRLTPFQYDPKTGRIWGHLAGWKSCHGALPDCVTPPRSQNGYRYFMNEPVHLSDGSQQYVGRLVCNTVHAKVRGINAEQAMAHYATTGSVFGLAACGEDDYGIWVSGAAVHLDPELLTLSLACPPSGDWRKWRGLQGRELIAGLAVPVPGFNTPQAEFAGEGELTGLIVSNIQLDRPETGAGILHPEVFAKLDKVTNWVESLMAKEAAESRRARIAELAAAYSR